MTHKDYYQILGVDRHATREEIQGAFHALARKYHPDVNPDPRIAERFKEISAAYEVLGDPKQRAKYDLRIGASWRRPQQTRSRPSGTTWRQQTSYNRQTEAHWYHAQHRTSTQIPQEEFGLIMMLMEIARIGGAITAIYLLLNLVADTLSSILGLPALGWEFYLVVTASLGGLASLSWGLYLREQNKCPRCRKPWAKENMSKERKDVFYRDVLLDGLPPVPHVRYRVHHRCKYCGHRWMSTQAKRLWYPSV